MEHPGFFERAAPIELAQLVEATGADLHDTAKAGLRLNDVKTLADAGPQDLTFLDNKKYVSQLATTRAAACLVSPAFKQRVPKGCIPLTMTSPYNGFAIALDLFYPAAKWPNVANSAANTPLIDPTADFESGVVVEAGAVIGPQVHIGAGSRIAAGAVVGARVHIGRNSYIGALATVTHALIGDNVTIHTGVRIGQDGFGFAMGPTGHLKVPQIGRVIIQDHVEIGANTAIDRGALNDTIIGEGSKIDNLVQIGHNVVMGRHCVIVGQTGISGSTELGDFVVMGGQSGTVGHIKVGDGAHIAGGSHPKNDVEAGARLAGTPAKPIRQWARELAAVTRLAKPPR